MTFPCKGNPTQDEIDAQDAAYRDAPHEASPGDNELARRWSDHLTRAYEQRRREKIKKQEEREETCKQAWTAVLILAGFLALAAGILFLSMKFRLW
jgi:hypothetical protein